MRRFLAVPARANAPKGRQPATRNLKLRTVLAFGLYFRNFAAVS